MFAILAHWLHGTDQRQTKLDRLRYWRSAVALQHDRLIASSAAGSVSEADSDELRRRCDMHFYLVAAANVRKAARSLKKRFSDPGVDAALAALDKSAPRLKRLRDFMEHFEAYDEGTGREQKRGSVPTRRMDEQYRFTPGVDAEIEAFGHTLSIVHTTPLVLALADAILGLELEVSGW